MFFQTFDDTFIANDYLEIMFIEDNPTYLITNFKSMFNVIIKYFCTRKTV